MGKAMFGIASALTLLVSPAWAADEADDNGKVAAATETKATVRSGESDGMSTGDAGKMEAGRTTSAVEESAEVRTSIDTEHRWLQEREGYRDGGY